MDRMRGFEADGLSGDDGYFAYDTDEGQDDAIEAPPVVGSDERRMQVRAYNFWTSLLGSRNFPCVEDLEPDSLPDFAAHSVLLDFTASLENPAIQYLGSDLASESGIDETIGYLDQVPSRSLLSRITDHCLQIIANRAPIGFEAEFVNGRGATIMYRGILLPFSSDDDVVDFVYGVINWKEVLGAQEADVLELELGHALATAPKPAPFPAFADGPRGAALPAIIETVPEDPVEIAPPAPASASLADWLDTARRQAAVAQEQDGRSRSALYRAIGFAYDFSLIADQNPDDYAALVAQAGLTSQDRAPMTPVVKLVFGASYDKTRLTEYAAALTHARRHAVPMGELAEMIDQTPGGLKAVVQAERAARKGDIAPLLRTDPRDRLRQAAPLSIEDFAGEGEEFVVLVGRREADGRVVLVGSIDDAALTGRVLDKAAR